MTRKRDPFKYRNKKARGNWKNTMKNFTPANLRTKEELTLLCYAEDREGAMGGMVAAREDLGGGVFNRSLYDKNRAQYLAVLGELERRGVNYQQIYDIT